MNLNYGTWLVAVSGGPDSMALLDMCIADGVKCACAHVNYHHRPQAEEEEAYVREYCLQNQLECYVKNDPFVWEGNFEAAARNCRYTFFARVVKEHGFSGVLTAHHMDDLLETYFMQEEKRVIPDFYGLREERMIAGVLVKRPLLGYTKQDLEKYCRKKGLKTFYDDTNSDRNLTRNRIRQDVIEPMSLREKQYVLQEISRRNAELSERRCRVRAWVGESGLTRAAYLTWQEPERLQALRDLLLTAGTVPTRKELLELDRVLCTKEDMLVPAAGKLLTVPHGRICLMDRPMPYAYTVHTPAELRTLSAPDFRVEDGAPGVNSVTTQEADWPLTIRSVRDGDKIGMRFGTKAVHRFFIDRKTARYDRLLWPVVTNRQGTVILVPGLGCDKGHYSICADISVIQLSRCDKNGG